jgi:alkaline phosphatase D
MKPSARSYSRFAVGLLIALLLCRATWISAAQIYLGQGVIAGEVTTNSVILQTRLTAAESVVDGEVPGIRGVARFEVDSSPTFAHPRQTEWLGARPDGDFIVKAKVDGLEPGTLYYFRVWSGSHERQAVPDIARSFRTLGGAASTAPVRFAVVSGMNYAAFQAGGAAVAADAVDRDNGYPALASIYRLQPDFLIGNGNNVYYDSPAETRAATLPEMRFKWHEQFVQVRMSQLLSLVPAYWLKNDRDYRRAGADTTGSDEPVHELGAKVFQEQVPVTDPRNTGAVTYRTHRLNRHVQVWLLEARDHRSGNQSPDGPAKSLWGKEQKTWLQRTLKESDATFKLLISPTPMISGGGERDSHASPGGFEHEGREFFAWLAEQGIRTNRFFILCGGVDWQYHARAEAGYEEFSSGPVLAQQANVARGTSAAGIVQVYGAAKPLGGFLLVEQTMLGPLPQLMITFKDESGTSLHFSRTLGSP